MSTSNKQFILRTFLVFFIGLLCSASAYSQTILATGEVIDQNQEPVIGATVREVGTNNGTATDLDGRYSLQVSRTSKLEISYIGFKNKVVSPGENVRIQLEEETNMLNEVVAIGYGSVRRADVTTAVSSISTKDLDTRPIVSAAAGMQGKAAGLMVSQANGQPGSSPTIRVRGTTSLNGSNAPLYVVDGVPVENIDYLSADDIDNIQVLKDASSAAIYGSRAANGVIIINTKQGKAGVAKISFNARYAFNSVRDNQKPLNTAQYQDLIRDMNEKGVLSLNLPTGLTDRTDWKKEIYQVGNVQDYQVSITNGTDKLRYYLSGGYTGETGVVILSKFKRYNIRAAIDNDINKWLTINANIAYSDYTYKGTGIISGTSADRGGVIPSILGTPTYAPIWDENDPTMLNQNYYGVTVDSPIQNIYRTKDNKSQYNKLLMTGKAIVTFMPGLKFTSSLTFDRNAGTVTNFLDPHITREGQNQHGTGYDSRSTGTIWTFDNVLDWKKSYGKNTLSAMGGSSWTHSKWSQNYINASDYANNLFKTLNAANKISWDGTGSSASEWSILSFFTRLQYNWNDTYMVTANLRADGSSRLAMGHKWGVFPSFSGAWRISNEKFMRNVKWINDLKLRAGWGQTGNQSGLGDYAHLAMYDFNRQQWWETGKEHAVVTTTQTSLSNPELTWEKTSQTDIGLDLTVLNNRLTFYIDWYLKRTTDLLLNVTLPAGSAAARNLTYNAGEIQNTGWEFTINSHNLVGAFKWDTDFNISFNKNKVKDLALTPIYWGATTNSNVNQAVVRNTAGHPLGAFYGYISEGVDPETGNLIYRDVSDDGVISSNDRTYIGDPNPDFTFGLTNSFSWKGFSLSILLQGSVGNDIYNVSRMESEGMFNARNQSTGVLRRWQIPGQVTDVPRVGFNQQNSSYYVEDGSYLRVKDISLSYDVPRSVISKLHLTRLMPYVSFSNLITWTNYTGRDPEVNQAGNSGGVQGIDWGTYPLNRSFVMGLKVEF